MTWCGIQGHDAVVERLRRSMRLRRLASSYLFIGPPGIGKRTFALRLAQGLLCDRHDERERVRWGDSDERAAKESARRIHGRNAEQKANDDESTGVPQNEPQHPAMIGAYGESDRQLVMSSGDGSRDDAEDPHRDQEHGAERERADEHGGRALLPQRAADDIVHGPRLAHRDAGVHVS